VVLIREPQIDCQLGTITTGQFSGTCGRFGRFQKAGKTSVDAVEASRASRFAYPDDKRSGVRK